MGPIIMSLCLPSSWVFVTMKPTASSSSPGSSCKCSDASSSSCSSLPASSRRRVVVEGSAFLCFHRGRPLIVISPTTTHSLRSGALFITSPSSEVIVQPPGNSPCIVWRVKGKGDAHGPVLLTNIAGTLSCWMVVGKADRGA